MSSHGLTAASDPVDPIVATVTSFDGTKIRYDLYEAPSETTIVVVPGFWRDRRHAAMRRLAAFLGNLGYRTAIIDVRGHGESGGTYGFNVHEHHDVAAVAQDLLARVGTTSSLTLVGFSYGGSIAISTAARHELPIASLLLISAVADFEMITPRVNPFTIHRHIAFFSQAMHKPRFAWRMRQLPKIRAVDDVVNVHAPLCLIHVKNDWLIGHRHSVALYDAANEPKELHLLDIAGNYHADRIFNVASESIEPITRDFLARYSIV
jgi:pimeloyl-ACP methyl ester carboxylesterase